MEVDEVVDDVTEAAKTAEMKSKIKMESLNMIEA